MLPSRRAAKDLGQALHLDHIADAGAGAVRFNQRRGSRIERRIFPGALHGQLLADGIRRGNALALAVAGAADAANDGIDLVPVALGIRQAFQQEGGRSFAHDEAIGPLAKGAAAGGAQRADLAEFDEGGDAHVVIDAAGEHRIDLVFDQQFNSGIDRREAGGAGGIGDEIGPAQIEHIGHAPGDDIGQFAGHRVFGDRRGRRQSIRSCHWLKIVSCTSAGSWLNSLAASRAWAYSGKDDPFVGHIVQLATHGRAHDHGRILRV